MELMETDGASTGEEDLTWAKHCSKQHNANIFTAKQHLFSARALGGSSSEGPGVRVARSMTWDGEWKEGGERD